MAVHGVGPAPCDFFLCGSEPGYREMQKGEPFVGPTGTELNRLLDVCGLPRSKVFLTNIYREPQDEHDSIYNLQLFEDGCAELREELARVQPKHIITLGRDAARLFLGDVDMDEVWGLHLKPPAEVFERFPELRPTVTILPQTHPAAGFRSPEASSQVLVGFENLRRILKQRLPARGLYDDPHPNPAYTELHTAGAVASFMVACPEFAMDTEGWTHKPWSMQLTRKPGEGVLIRTKHPDALRELQLQIRAHKPRLTMHSGLHDIAVARQMGIDIIEEGIEFDDTQLMAYLLGVIPQGLKQLAVRELAMPMQSYREVLGDAQDRYAVTYLSWLWDELNAEHQRMRHEDFEFQRTVAKRRIRVLPKLPKSGLLKAVERVLGSKEPARLWGDQVLDIQVDAHKRLGPLPEASLSDVNPEVALRYAGRDPDATWRLKQVLRPHIKDMGLEGVYQLDLSTCPILDRMMQIGITPDVKAFSKLAKKLDIELSEIRHKLRTTTAEPNFNANSGDQVAAYLFDELGLESPGRRLASGRESTNDKILEALEKEHPQLPQIADIRSYREYYKLRWTFVERLPEFKNRWPRDGRIHCELMLTRTPSGRLAAKNPNLLAMPKHGKFAKDFRRCFVPSEERLFLSLDLSQIELRVAAHLSQDPEMLAIFRGERRNPDGSPIDLHAHLAHRVFGVLPQQQDESKHRLPAKCFHPDVEVLTRRGWVRILDLELAEEIVQAEPQQSGEVSLSWIRPTQVFSEHRDELVELYSEGMHLRVTPDHRMVGWSAGGKLLVEHPHSFATKARYWANAGMLTTRAQGPAPVLLRLAVATQADGSITKWKSIKFGFSKRRKIERMRELLISAGIAGHESSAANGKYQRTTTFSIHKKDAVAILELLDADKRLPWEWLDLPAGAREVVLDEMAHWDSCRKDNWRMTRYTSFVQKNLDVMQALASITNRKTRLVGTSLSVRTRHNSRGGNLAVRDVRYSGPVACLSVPSSFVLVRDKGVPVIVGQSINFGYWMGQTAVGLQVELRKNGLDVDQDTAQEWLDGMDTTFKQASVYKARMVAEAERNGYVRCLSGRIRYIGGIRSRDERVRAEAERFAYSTPVQEGAQWLGKRALARAWQEIYVPMEKAGHYCEPVLWVHDDLLSEVDEDIVLAVAPQLQAIMTAPPPGFSVPLATTPEAGYSWGDMVKL